MESQGGDGWKKWAEIERKSERERKTEQEDLRFLASFPERYTLLDKRTRLLHSILPLRPPAFVFLSRLHPRLGANPGVLSPREKESGSERIT